MFKSRDRSRSRDLFTLYDGLGLEGSGLGLGLKGSGLETQETVTVLIIEQL